MGQEHITLRPAQAGDARTIARMSRDLVEQGLGWTWNPQRVEAALRNRLPDSAATSHSPSPEWAEEFWVPHRSELIRIAMGRGLADLV